MGRFEKVERSKQVHVEVEPRVVDRGTHPGHGSQVGDGVDFLLAQKPSEQIAVAHVSFDETKVRRRFGADLGKVRTFADGS